MGVPSEKITRLRAAYAAHQLTLFVGAGASVASGLPNWSQLLKRVFINSFNGIGNRDPAVFQAAAQEWFDAIDMPLEIVARELRASFEDPARFLSWVRFALYAGVPTKPSGLPAAEFIEALENNKTLSALAEMCSKSTYGTSGVRRVVSYNFDDLLELRLGTSPHCTIWGKSNTRPARLPIYHVHGYLPTRNPDSPYPANKASHPNEIVLTEDQYHREAATPYAWSNLIQLQSTSDSVGLTVGLSMTDPNMRRLLDIGAQTSVKPEIYSLQQRRVHPPLTSKQLEAIAAMTNQLLQSRPWLRGRMTGKSITASKSFVDRCRKHWVRMEDLVFERQVKVMNELGVQPIWCAHDEIPDLLAEVARS